MFEKDPNGDLVIIIKDDAYWIARSRVIYDIDEKSEQIKGARTYYYIDESFSHNGFDTAADAYSYLLYLHEKYENEKEEEEI